MNIITRIRTANKENKAAHAELALAAAALQKMVRKA